MTVLVPQHLAHSHRRRPLGGDHQVERKERRLVLVVGLALVLESLLIGTASVLRPLDASLVYGPAYARSLVEHLSALARQLYYWFNIVDFAFIGVYSVLLLNRFNVIFGRDQSISWLRLVAVLPGLCDLIETAGVAMLLHGSEPVVNVGVWLAVFGTPLKWVAAMVTAGTLGIGEWRWYRKRAIRQIEWLTVRST